MLITLTIMSLIIILVVVLALYLFARHQLRTLQQIHEGVVHDHRSSLIKHGMSFEQLFPYMKNYPYNPRNFRFIGDPIDGISFEDDGIIFIEFKTGNANLSTTQKRIKDFINKKRVEWKEIRES